MGKSDKSTTDDDSPNSGGTDLNHTQVFSVDEHAEIIIKNASEKQVELLKQQLRDIQVDKELLMEKLNSKNVENSALQEKIFHFAE